MDSPEGVSSTCSIQHQEMGHLHAWVDSLGRLNLGHLDQHQELRIKRRGEATCPEDCVLLCMPLSSSGLLWWVPVKAIEVIILNCWLSVRISITLGGNSLHRMILKDTEASLT